jgi:DNA invertase Pin-like site-specific DNA recombinase
VIQYAQIVDKETAMKTACAYFRTSSATGVGADKDSLKRQQDAVRAYAGGAGIEIVHEYYDAAVSGADPLLDRPGFAEMVKYMLGNGARTILVENAGRFARDTIIALTGYEYLKKQDIELIAVDCPSQFTDDSDSAKMIRGILALVSAFEKDSLVSRMRKARERMRRETGRCEGRKPVPTEVVAAARVARAQGMSLRKVAAELERQGFKQYGAQSIKLMISKV